MEEFGAMDYSRPRVYGCILVGIMKTRMQKEIWIVRSGFILS